MSVQEHYDGVSMTTRQERAKGRLYDMKKFHNLVKRNLLRTYATFQERLLDLGCGRGGDLDKWKECRIGYIRGLDISSKEIEEAQRRASLIRTQIPRCRFDVADLTQPMEQEPDTYDTVSAMFCIHYFFGSVKHLKTFMETVSKHLRYGGFFIGTCLDSAKVQEWVSSGKTSDVLTVTPGKNFLLGGGYGREYTFDLCDTVTEGATTEYLVDMAELTRVAEQFGLRFKEAIPFMPPTQYEGYDASVMCTTFVFIKNRL